MFNGLRVRMGTASGYVPADAKDVASSCIVAKAKRKCITVQQYVHAQSAEP
jgi:hypothetical protein